MKGVGFGVRCVPVPKNIRFLHEKVHFCLLVVKCSLKWQRLTLIPKESATSWQIIWEGLCPLYTQMKVPHCIIEARRMLPDVYTYNHAVYYNRLIILCRGVSASVTRLHSPKTVERFAVCGRDYCWPIRYMRFAWDVVSSRSLTELPGEGFPCDHSAVTRFLCDCDCATGCKNCASYHNQVKQAPLGFAA